MASLLQALFGSRGSAAVVGSDAGLIKENLYFTDFGFVASTTGHLVGGGVITAYNFVL